MLCDIFVYIIYKNYEIRPMSRKVRMVVTNIDDDNDNDDNNVLLGR